MSNFKKGDLVRCISKDLITLSFNNVYKVIDINDGMIMPSVLVVNNFGNNISYFSYRFVLDIEANRNEVIDEILNDN